MFPFFPVSCPCSLLCFHSQFFCFVCYCSSTCSKLSEALWQWSRKRKESWQLCLCNLNICIEKSQCKELIGGDDISNDVITLGMCFQCLSTFVLISALRLLAKSDSSVDGEPQGNWRWNSNYRDIVASSPSFLPYRLR